MSFPRYPKYKDSGVEWLGEVPEGWESFPLRTLAKEGRKTFVDGDWIESPYITDDGIRLIQTGNIGIGIYREQGFRFVSEQTFASLDCTEVTAGDVLICRLAEPVGRACIAPKLESRMITSVDVCILKTSDKVDAKYTVYLLSSPDYLDYMESQCRGGTRDRVSRSFLCSVRVPFPPFPEQTLIATFLDRETIKIDALIAEYQHLISLLAEKRQAVISHAVTKGLDPNVKLKDSGVEWLGQVPEHWGVNRIKYLSTRISSGKTPLGGSEVYMHEGITFLRSQNVYDEGLRLDDVVFITAKVDEAMAVSRVLPNDILLNITGASIGRSCVVPTEFSSANVNQHVCVIRLKDTHQVPFVGLLFKTTTIKNQIDYTQNGAAREGLNFVQIGEMTIPLPPMAEQSIITKFINRETTKLEILTTEAHRAIDLLKERRSAVIFAAVTGKIDVRNLVKC